MSKIVHDVVPGFGVSGLGLPGWNAPFRMSALPDNVKMLGSDSREWQLVAFGEGKDQRFFFVSAFCGSGKTILQVYLAAYEMIASRGLQRQMFVVPQSHIGAGFSEKMTIELDGKRYDWRIGGNNFCDYSDARVIDGLIDWLLKPSRREPVNPRELSGFAVATHQALVRAWVKMENEVEKKLRPASDLDRAFLRLTLRVDEAHHIAGVYDSDEDVYTADEKRRINQESTILGRICLRIFHSRDKTSRLHLTTATPYRGDCGIWLTPMARKRFVSYYLPWIDHWRTLKIGSFEVLYEFYDQDPIELVIARILEEPNERHMIIVPPTKGRWRLKGSEIKRLFARLYELKAQGLIQGEILDLVTVKTQAANKARLLEEPKSGNDADGNPVEPKFRVVVTCMLGREGTDWVPCSRLHNTACEQSLTLAVQTLGRPFRMYIRKVVDPKTGEVHGIGLKENVRIFNYIERFPEPKEGMTRAELFSARNNAMLVCTQWDEMCYPLLLAASSSIKLPSKAEPRKRLTLMEALGDQSSSILRDLFEEVECLEVIDREHVYTAIAVVLADHEVESDDMDALTAALFAEVRRRQLTPEEREQVHHRLMGRFPTLKGIDVQAFLIEGIGELETVLSNRRMFFRKSYDEDYFKLLRRLIKGKTFTFYQMLEEYKERVLKMPAA